MKEKNDISASAALTAPKGFRRVAPAFALFFVAPFVAEFLLGDFSIDAWWLLLIMAPLYGGGALVVREVVRRMGRGWPTMLLLAFAYGLVEEGIVIQTLFNPNYLGLHLLDQAYVPALGIGVWWSSYVLTLHTAWSISVPIAIVEGMFADRRTTPWLGRTGLCVAFFLYVAGCLMIHFTSRKQDPFSASWTQELSVWCLIALVATIAFLCCKKRGPRQGSVPAVWIVGLSIYLWGMAFTNAHQFLHGWILAGAELGLDGIALALLFVWSRREGWTPLHMLGAAGGALLTYACMGFPQQPVAGSPGMVDLVGNAVFAAVAIVLLFVALRRTRRAMVANR
jgi:hypothetical protein